MPVEPVNGTMNLMFCDHQYIFNGNSNSVSDGTSSLLDCMPFIGKSCQNYVTIHREMPSEQGKAIQSIVFILGLRHFLIACYCHSSGPQHQPHLCSSREAQTIKMICSAISPEPQNGIYLRSGVGLSCIQRNLDLVLTRDMRPIYMKTVHKSFTAVTHWTGASPAVSMSSVYTIYV